MFDWTSLSDLIREVDAAKWNLQDLTGAFICDLPEAFSVLSAEGRDGCRGLDSWFMTLRGLCQTLVKMHHSAVRMQAYARIGGLKQGDLLGLVGVPCR